MEGDKKRIGNWGEEQACLFLKKHAFVILARNFFTKHGELDIIAYDTVGKQLVFCEVKTRINSDMAEYSINNGKLRKMLKAAWVFMRSKNKITENFRFDSVGINLVLKQKKAKIRHHKAISDCL